MEQHGADALRWFFAASGSPWSTRRVGHATLDEIVRKVLLTYWNTVSFLTLYANAAAADGNAWGPDRLGEAPAPAQRPVLDRWVLSELHTLVRDVTELMEGFDTAGTGRRIAGFLDDLSNWYVRRSRRRFWEGPRTSASSSAFATLYECLETVTRLMAPITPFLTDHVWSALRTPDAPESVHLARWPEANPALIDEELSAQMALTRRLVELGRSARATATVKTRQPLARALVGATGFASMPAELRAQVAEELNVHALEPLSSVGGDLVDYTVKPNYRALGRRFGKGTPPVAAAIGAADGAELATVLREDGQAAVMVDGEPVTVSPDEVVVTQTPKEGWTVASDGGETVALETLLTPELRREGLAREAIRLIQDARKSDGLDVTDRIELWWEASGPELSAALEEQGPLIAREVLATSYQDGHPPAEAGAGVYEHRDPGLGLNFWLGKA
jgi:isoleucyl-tRNA synthetase